MMSRPIFSILERVFYKGIRKGNSVTLLVPVIYQMCWIATCINLKSGICPLTNYERLKFSNCILGEEYKKIMALRAKNIM